MFIKKNLEKHLEPSVDSEHELRNYKRLPINISLLYCFPEKMVKRTYRISSENSELKHGDKKLHVYKLVKKELKYDQCNTLDVAHEGIGLEILTSPEKANEFLNQKNKIILIKIDIKKNNELIEFTGKINWHRIIKQNDKITRIYLGVKYYKISNDDKTNILKYAIQYHHRKRLIKTSIITLGVFLCIALTWGTYIRISKTRVEEKLTISEVNRLKLTKEVKSLVKTKNQILEEITENTTKIKEQKIIILKSEKKNKIQRQLNTKLESKIKNQNKAIIRSREELKIAQNKFNKQKNDLKEIKKKFEKYGRLQAQLEKNLYNYIVVFDQNIILYEANSDIKIIRDNDYIESTVYMKNKNFNHAILSLKKVIKKNPDAGLLYKDLARAYYRLGKHKQSKEGFSKFLNLQIQNVK
jgi:tetratricopeptide (TPR) repeat protein